MTHARTLAALYRSPSFSPNQHRANDTAILDATVEHLAQKGWIVKKLLEHDIENGRVPFADLYVNMCQGPVASEHLVPIESDGVLVVNTPSSVLNCHRHRLVKRMAMGGVAFPFTVIVNTEEEEDVLGEKIDGAFPDLTAQVWLKRGDVHAERQEDVIPVSVAGLRDAMHGFAQRGISWVAIQEHVPGPVIKFYGVAGRQFFRWYDSAAGIKGARPRVDEARLQELAFCAAETLGLEVFGGDVAIPQPDRPVLIDINDWPSFAPFRADAAAAIADYVDARARKT
jgi:hypothetical protein